MKFNIELDLHPFKTPNYVLVKDGMKESKSFHVGELSNEVLNTLCDGFREEIFKKANDYRTSKKEPENNPFLKIRSLEGE